MPAPRKHDLRVMPTEDGFVFAAVDRAGVLVFEARYRGPWRKAHVRRLQNKVCRKWAAEGFRKAMDAWYAEQVELLEACEKVRRKLPAVGLAPAKRPDVVFLRQAFGLPPQGSSSGR